MNWKHVQMVHCLKLSLSRLSLQENKALASKGTAAMYGMVASMPDKSIVDDFIVEFFSECYKL